VRVSQLVDPQKGAGRVAIEQAKDKLSHKRDLSGDDSEPDLEV
jgi:hypothetical protein